MSSDIDYKFRVVVDAVKILDDPPQTTPKEEGDLLSPKEKEKEQEKKDSTKIDPKTLAFQLRWFVSDALKGASDFIYNPGLHNSGGEDNNNSKFLQGGEGTEVPFQFQNDFQLESNSGVVTHLLQLSVICCDPAVARSIEHGQNVENPEKVVRVIGVLMIDLNAHVPKPPKQVSSQKATLYLSRSPLLPAPLIRINISCVPVKSALSLPPSSSSPAASTSALSAANPASMSSPSPSPSRGLLLPQAESQERPRQQEVSLPRDNSTRSRVIRFYHKYDKTKVPEADSIVAKHCQTPEATERMFAYLTSKYGDEPPASDAQNSVGNENNNFATAAAASSSSSPPPPPSTSSSSPPPPPPYSPSSTTATAMSPLPENQQQQQQQQKRGSGTYLPSDNSARSRVIRFYHRYDKSKIPEADSIVAKHCQTPEATERMFSHLTKKYGDEPPSTVRVESNYGGNDNNNNNNNNNNNSRYQDYSNPSQRKSDYFPSSSSSSSSSSPLDAKEQAALIDELLDMPPPDSMRGLQNAYETARKQMRNLVQQNEQQRREIVALQRRNKIQQEEMSRLRNQVSEEGVSRVRAAYEARVMEYRCEIESLNSCNSDLRSLAQSAEVLAESLTRELEQAKYEAREGTSISRGMQSRLDEEREKNERYERAIRHGQEEITNLHNYCAQAKSGFEDALMSLHKTRAENAHLKRRAEDLQKLLDASRIADRNSQSSGVTNLPLR